MKKKQEVRELENITDTGNNAEVLRTIIGDDTKITPQTAMEIPMVARCVNMVAGAVAALPIKLYRKHEGRIEEITDDIRLKLLNGDTGDTMNADYMRCAWVRDLLLSGNAYAYIETRGGIPQSLYYIAAENVSIFRNENDPIYKQFTYRAGATSIQPWQMLKILRNTDGYGGGRGIVEENREILGTAYNLITYQRGLMKRGGGKRGILRTQNAKKDYLAEIKRKWNALWTSRAEADSVFIINSQDMDFKELSSSSVEMQLNETQKTIDEELMKLFGTNDGILSDDTVKNAVMPVIDMIEAALDSDLLLEREKDEYYFAFDTRELTRGDMNQRYTAYATALSQNFMQLDEVRALEDLPPLGINFVKLGLNDVLLDPKTGQIYTPNTNAYAQMGANAAVPVDENTDLTTPESRGIIEERGWVTIGGRHVLMDKDSGSGGGSSGVSAKGVNKFQVRNFRSKQKRKNHFKDHKDLFEEDGITTEEQYVEEGLKLAESPVVGSVLGHKDGHGNVIRYDKDKNWFVKGNPSRGLTTFYKPEKRIGYYNEQLEEDLKHGGSNK